MSFQRQVARQHLKSMYGHNRIKNAWRDLQIKRYGFKTWFALMKASKGGRTLGKNI